MQSRETRFVLRIETGERQGEQVALPEGVLQVGRRPDCGLVLKDGSVSGKHAEFRVGEGKVQLVDLGSTNGTRVGGHKVEQAMVGHGDVLLLGNVRMTLHDVELAGAPAAAATGAPEASLPAGDSGLGHVSADKVTRSRAGARRLPLLLGALLVLGGGAFAYLRFLRGGGPAVVRVEVPAVPGNLLADGSFEEGTGGWSAAESAPVAFLRDRSFARSGEAGLGVNLDGGGWSLARSEELVLHPRRSLACAASLRVDGSAEGRIGVELSSAAGAMPAFVAWSRARTDSGGSFEELQLAFDVLGDYDRARLVVAGRGQGSVALDDVSALEKEPALDAPKFNEYQLAVLGGEGSTAVLVRSGRVLLAGLDLSAWTRAELAGWAGARLAAESVERGFELAFPGAPADAKLSFWAVRPDTSGSAPADAWVATTGTEGYAAHGGDFTRAGVTSLLLGSGLELLRLSFERPVAVAATAGGGALHCTVELGGLERCEIQLAFQQERAEAATLAGRAEELEKARDLGSALATWTELLDRFPFERKLVARAEEARARLVQTGLAQVGEVRRELVQARFFLLPELFRKGEARALELAAAYRGSEVEAEARKAGEECRMALTELAAGGRSGEAQRLRGVLEALDPARSPRLVEHVKSALEGVDPGGMDD